MEDEKTFTNTESTWTIYNNVLYNIIFEAFNSNPVTNHLETVIKAFKNKDTYKSLDGIKDGIF